jgi:iron complex transport system permease protein
MKITLDLADLVSRGELTKDEADKLAKLGARDTGSLGVNILMGFGTIAVAVGGGFLFPTAQSVIVIGAILFVIGLALILNKQTKWALFAQICVTIGALGMVGGISFLSDGNFYVNLGLALGLAVSAFVAGSGLLGALAILQFSLALGAGTAYWHGGYFTWVEEPTLTIVVLAVLSIALTFVATRLPSVYERVALIMARTAVLMINLAFLIGSIFGDQLVSWDYTIRAEVFSVVWALLLVGVGLWGVMSNRRWVVNAAAVFGAIHFYTQWFEYLGPNPLSVLGGGILLIGFGFALRWFNTKFNKPPAAAAATA